MDKKPFNYDEALEKLKSGKPITGEDGVFTPLLKQMAEALLGLNPESRKMSHLLP